MLGVQRRDRGVFALNFVETRRPPGSSPTSPMPPGLPASVGPPLPAPAHLPGPALPLQLPVSFLEDEESLDHGLPPCIRTQDSRKIHCSHHPYFFPTFSHHKQASYGLGELMCAKHPKQCLAQGKPNPAHQALAAPFTPPPSICPKCLLVSSSPGKVFASSEPHSNPGVSPPTSLPPSSNPLGAHVLISPNPTLPHTSATVAWPLAP